MSGMAIYHLRRTAELRDFLRSIPWFRDQLGDSVMEAMRQYPGFTTRPEVDKIMKELVEPCIMKTTTNEGAEVCLNSVREDILKFTKGSSYAPQFEEFLKAIDKVPEDIRTDYYEKHIL